MKHKPLWIQQAGQALRRAAARARELAARTNAPLHVMRDGKIVEVAPAAGAPMLREGTGAYGRKKG